jgi:hypothetical protein
VETHCGFDSTHRGIRVLRGGGNNRAEMSDWPNGMSFVIVDEMPDALLGTRLDDPPCPDLPLNARLDRNNVAPTLRRVLLLPLVQNYRWRGECHRLAFTDPILARPGEDAISTLLSPLLRDGQQVRRCILLAHGYCPGDLYPQFNLAAKYNGRDVWPTEMARLPEEQFQAVSEIIIRELSGTTLKVYDIKGVYGVPFDEAIRLGKILGLSWMVSPLSYSGDPAGRPRYVLSGVPGGTDISVCLSPEGLERVKTELIGLQRDKVQVRDTK